MKLRAMMQQRPALLCDCHLICFVVVVFYSPHFPDHKAILTVNFTFPVVFPLYSYENTHVTVKKSQKKSISNLSVALWIMYSCGQHHGG